MIDLSTYLQRIHYTGSTEPTLETLAALQYAHVHTIPFESLDIHLGREIRLEVPRIFEKVVHQGRGGFCYELNGLFHELLAALGFKVRRISVRVYNTEEPEKGFGPEFDHMANIITLPEGEFLVDVGFGDFAQRPLKMVVGQVQEDPWGRWQITDEPGGGYRLTKLKPEGPLPKYLFSTTPRAFGDFAGMCHYQQYNPESHFYNRQVMSLPNATGRVSLTQDKLKVTHNGEVTETLVKDRADFEVKLWEYFKIKL